MGAGCRQASQSLRWSNILPLTSRHPDASAFFVGDAVSLSSSMMPATQGLRVSTRRTSVTGPKVVTRAAIARQSRSGGASNVTSIAPQPKKQRRPRQPKKKVEHVADEVVADEVLTPDWEARGARADQGRGPSQSRDVEVDQLDVPDRHDVQAVVPYPKAG